MGLTSSLFSGVSGLSTLGNSMTVIGNNIANVNTIGFKSSSVIFQDVLSQTVATQSGTSQVGRGTSLGDVMANFGQGSFQSTSSPTDLAIGGEGFFVLGSPDNANDEYFSRAGSFTFDKNGNFTNPAGYIVKGWKVTSNASGTAQNVGSLTNIKLDSFTSPPEATDSVSLITNLDSSGADNTTAGLATAWNGTNDPPIPESAYDYQSTMKVYDSLGDTHDVTVYFDKTGQSNTYEYIVTGNPSEDLRSGVSSTSSGAGLYGAGTLTFSDTGSTGTSSSGTLTKMTFFSFDGTGNPSNLPTDLTNESVSNTGDYTSNTVNSSNPYYTFNPDFLGTGSPQSIDLNFGTKWDGSQWVPDSLATTMYSSASTTVYESATGYGAGDLQSISVGTDGVMTGQYSNGQVTPLFRVALAKFQNEQGLFKQGGSLYKETRTSGPAITNNPGTSGLGSIASNSLEESNVDISSEFVDMITTQRGFQANSKIVTTVDSMLGDTINMIR